jgi:hypothetical protein
LALTVIFFISAFQVVGSWYYSHVLPHLALAFVLTLGWALGIQSEPTATKEAAQNTPEEVAERAIVREGLPEKCYVNCHWKRQ